MSETQSQEDSPVSKGGGSTSFFDQREMATIYSTSGTPKLFWKNQGFPAFFP